MGYNANHEIIEKARELHAFMLRKRNPRYALPRLGLALDLASMAVKNTNNPLDVRDRWDSMIRITRFVERNT